jgi:heme-degrading monooxygenase HmoA
MYARLVTLKLKPGSMSTAEKLADQAVSVIRGLKGFKDVTFFGNNDTGEYGSLSLWETEEDAEAVSKATQLQIRDVVGGLLMERPMVRICEVYGPKG